MDYYTTTLLLSCRMPLGVTKGENFVSECHLSSDLHSLSGDKHSRCKSNTWQHPGRQTTAVGPPLLNLISGWLKKQSSYLVPPPPSTPIPSGRQNLLLSPGPAAFCPAENSITIGLCVHSVGGIFPLHCEVHSSAELGPWGF